MSDERDVGDELATAVAAAVGGCLFGLLAGIWQQRQRAKWEQERQLRLPGVLELPEELEPQPKRVPQYLQKELWYNFALVTSVGTGVYLTFMAFGLGVVAIAGNPTVPRAPLAIVSFIVGTALGYGTYRLWQYRRSLNAAKDKRDEPVVDVSHIEPLDLSKACVYTVRVPKSTPWNPQAATRFMEQLAQKFWRLTFQIVAEHGQLSWRILDLRRGLDPSVLQQTVHAFYPAADIREGPLERESFTEPFYRYVMGFRQLTEPLFPLKYAEQLSQGDPLVPLTQEMSELRPGERLIYTVVIADYARFVYDQWQDLVSVKRNLNPFQFFSVQGWLDAGISLTDRDQQRLAAFEPEVQQIVETKVMNLVYQGLVLLEVQTPSFERTKDLCRIHSQFLQFGNFPYGFMLWEDDAFPDTIEYVDDAGRAQALSTLGRLGAWLLNQDTRWRDYRMILDPHELAALWHLPHREFTAPSVDWAQRRVQMPQKVRSLTRDILLGKNEFSGRSDLVYLLDEDRATHTNILGRTGVGKSTLLHHLITQDIVQGHGVAVIDPHGSLVRDVLQTSIPKEREEDVVVLDIADVDYPPPLNPLAGTQTRAATGRIISILEKLYGGFENAPRMANALSSALMTLSFEPQATVRDVVRLFTDETYRAQLLARLDDEVAEEFWRDEYEAVSASQQQQIREPVIYRMRSFYSLRDLYPIICHPGRIDFGELMDQRKIVLVSLAMDEEHIPERERNLIGAIAVSQLQMAAMRQAGRVDPFYLYIDEVQNFVTTSLDKAFSEARKFKLSLTVANQYLQQLAGNTLEALMGTVGAMIVFQCGLDDARRLAPYMAPEFTAEDLLNLDKYQAAVKLRVAGETQPAFSLTTLPPRTADTFGPEGREACLERERRIRERSHDHYTPMTCEEVLAWLAERYPRRGKAAGMADAGDFFEA